MKSTHLMILAAMAIAGTSQSLSANDLANQKMGGNIPKRNYKQKLKKNRRK